MRVPLEVEEGDQAAGPTFGTSTRGSNPNFASRSWMMPEGEIEVLSGLPKKRRCNRICAFFWILVTMSITVAMVLEIAWLWGYFPVNIVGGICAVILAMHCLRCAVGSHLWMRRFSRIQDEDWQARWRTEKQNGAVLAWGDIKHFVIVAMEEVDETCMKHVAYSLMQQRGEEVRRRGRNTIVDPTHFSNFSDFAAQANCSFCKAHLYLVFAFKGSYDVDAFRRVKAEIGSEFCDLLAFQQPLGSLINCEIGGCASTLKYALNEVDRYAKKAGLRPQNCLVHTAGNDVLFDPNYFPYVTYDVCLRPCRDIYVWYPCVVPTGRFWQASPLARQLYVREASQEMMYSKAHCELRLPYSVCAYTLTTLRFIGLGRAGDAIDGDGHADDYHLFLKAWYATEGRMYARAVPYPCFSSAAPKMGFMRQTWRYILTKRFDKTCSFFRTVGHSFELCELAYFSEMFCRSSRKYKRNLFRVSGARTFFLLAKLTGRSLRPFICLWAVLGLVYAHRSFISYGTFWPILRIWIMIGLWFIGDVVSIGAFAEMLQIKPTRISGVILQDQANSGPTTRSGTSAQLCVEKLVFGIFGGLHFIMIAIVSSFSLLIAGN